MRNGLVLMLRLTIGVAAFAVAACDARTAPSEPGLSRESARRMSRARNEDIIPLSTGENAALDRLVAALPEEHRARARKAIAEKIAAGHFVRIRDNPKLQRLLDDVYAARIAAHTPPSRKSK